MNPIQFILFTVLILPFSTVTGDYFSNKMNVKQAYLPQSGEIKKLNVHYMLSGYFYALNRNANPGWSKKGAIEPNAFPYFYIPQKDTIELVAFPNQESVFQDAYKGFKVVLANPTDKDFKIGVQDSALPIVMQAKIKGKDWQDIEYLGSSSCGNSYNTVMLASNEALVLTAPIYHGEIEAKLRFISRGATLVSNVFEGRVNKAQLTTKFFTDTELSKNMGVITNDMVDKQY